MVDLERKFKMALAYKGSNVTKQATIWGVNESAIRNFLAGRQNSAPMKKRIEDYVKEANLQEVLAK